MEDLLAVVRNYNLIHYAGIWKLNARHGGATPQPVISNLVVIPSTEKFLFSA